MLTRVWTIIGSVIIGFVVSLLAGRWADLTTGYFILLLFGVPALIGGSTFLVVSFPNIFGRLQSLETELKNLEGQVAKRTQVAAMGRVTSTKIRGVTRKLGELPTQAQVAALGRTTSSKILNVRHSLTELRNITRAPLFEREVMEFKDDLIVLNKKREIILNSNGDDDRSITRQLLTRAGCGDPISLFPVIITTDRLVLRHVLSVG